MDTESKKFCLTLNLEAFFADYRQLAKILVPENITKIEDLEAKIGRVFGIKYFHLTYKDYYLPSLEDIQIIERKSVIKVVPNEPLDVEEALALTKSYYSHIPEHDINKKRKIKTNKAQENESVPIKKRKKAKPIPTPVQESSNILSSTPCYNKNSRSRSPSPNVTSSFIEVTEAQAENIENEQDETPDADIVIGSSSCNNSKSLIAPQIIPPEQQNGKPASVKFVEKMHNKFGVGRFLEQLKSTSEASSSNLDTTWDDKSNITKRKRKRVRKRPYKDTPFVEKPKVQNYFPTGLRKNLVKPLIHFKFSDQEDSTSAKTPDIPRDAQESVEIDKDVVEVEENGADKANEVKDTTIDSVQEFEETQINFAKPNKKINILSNISLGRKSNNLNDETIEGTFFNEEMIAEHPPMRQNPKPEDVIAFRILTLTEDITPTVSPFIIGEVIKFDETNTILFYIRHGLEFCDGHESLNTESEEQLNGDNTKREFLWSLCLDPHLLYPVLD